MNYNKFIDTASVVQVLGNIYNNPNILDQQDKYFFNEEDFVEEFHKVIFGSMHDLYALGAKSFSITAIEDYLAQRPKYLSVYEVNKGSEYLEKLHDINNLATFDYYYNKMKKMTLLRMYVKVGVDVSWVYNPDNILDLKKKQAQEDWLDNHTPEEIADLIDGKVSQIKEKFVANLQDTSFQAGDGITELIDELAKTPGYGYPMYGSLINTVTRGARFGKFYLRSGSSGAGKTRAMIADVCNFACSQIYSLEEHKWIQNGTKEPSMFIATEQDKSEVQTMMLAFLSGVNEEKIVYGGYEGDEQDRVLAAAETLKRSPLYVERLPDFSLQDIENTIKRAIREKNVHYFCFDYIQSTMKILSEISSRSKVSNLREDTILFMLSVKLKDICTEYNVFIMSGTQVSGDFKDVTQPDQTMLRGAKSIAD